MKRTRQRTSSNVQTTYRQGDSRELSRPCALCENHRPCTQIKVSHICLCLQCKATLCNLLSNDHHRRETLSYRRFSSCLLFSSLLFLYLLTLLGPCLGPFPARRPNSAIKLNVLEVVTWYLRLPSAPQLCCLSILLSIIVFPADL